MLSAAINLKFLFLDSEISDQELLEMAQVLQSNTSLTYLDISSNFTRKDKYSDESLTKFVEIVTAPESKSRLKNLLFGDLQDDKDAATKLLRELTSIIASRGHSLKVESVCRSEPHSIGVNLGQQVMSRAKETPDLLLYGKM